MDTRENRKEVPLQQASIELYEEITEGLSEMHIHPYDIQAVSVAAADGLSVYIRYGEGFSHEEGDFFTYEEIKNNGSKITEFISKCGEACRDVLIADYYKMMKP